MIEKSPQPMPLESKPAPYPYTGYVDGVAQHHPFLSGGLDSSQTQLTLSLVRSVCLAAEFGQGSEALTNEFASKISSRDVSAWLESEKCDYPVLVRRVENFFERRGADQLAEQALVGLEVGSEVRDAKASFIMQSWETCRKNMPTLAQLRDITPTHDQVKEALIKGPSSWFDLLFHLDDRVDNFRSTNNLLRHFIAVDAASITDGRVPGTFTNDPHESMFREAILMQRPTNNFEYDQTFWEYGEHIAAGSLKPELRALKKTWKRHHKRQKFMPDSFEDVRARVNLSEYSQAVLLRRLE